MKKNEKNQETKLECPLLGIRSARLALGLPPTNVGVGTKYFSKLMGALVVP